MQPLQDASNRTISVDEAMSMVEKFADSLQLHNDTDKYEDDEYVFGALCMKYLIVEKLRAELAIRKSCPVSLGLLSHMFAVSYCSVLMTTAPVMM